MNPARCRWLLFSAVGLLGAGVQLTAIHFMTDGFGWNSVLTTTTALELTLIHNFLWHDRLTWRDRSCSGISVRLQRFVLFHLSNGGVSLLGNIAITELILRNTRLSIVVANGMAICTCAVANFFVGDRLVFRPLSSSI